MFGDLPPSSVVDGMRFWAAYCMISRPVTVSPVNAIFAMRLLVASALPISAPGPLTTLITPVGSTSSSSSISLRIDHGVGLAGFSTTVLPAARAGRQLPRRHQEREVERDDLPDHSEWLVEVVGDRVLVDLRDRALLAADHRGEVAEVVGGERDVRRERLAHGLAVLPALGDRRASRGSPRSRPPPCSGRASARSPRPRAQASFAACAASSASSTSSAVERGTSVNASPVAGVTFSEYSPFTGATHWPPMKFS